MNTQTLSHTSQSVVEGKLALWACVSVSLLIYPDADLPSGFFDFPPNLGGITPDMSPMVSFDNTGELDAPAATTSFLPVNHRMSVSGGASVHTISPQDLMLDSMSAPPSTTITDLTTPGTNYMDSPFLVGSSNTSPLFATDHLGTEADHWSSLFSDDLRHEPETISMKSPAFDMHAAPLMSRSGSSRDKSLSKTLHHGGSHSSVAGVSAKRRDKPLPAITIDDPTDAVAVKRARNTMAARKSRLKRVERNEELMTQVADLEKQVDYWKKIAISCGHIEQ